MKKNAKRRQPLRGVMKWGGVTLCVLLFALWLASGWWMLAWVGRSGQQHFIGTMMYGGECTIWSLPSGTREWFPFPADGFSGLRHVPGWNWTYFELSWSDWSVQSKRRLDISFPLWLPFLLLALPTGLLFWSDHRKRMRPNACATCGYDLTGNTSGKCPECGVRHAVATSDQITSGGS